MTEEVNWDEINETLAKVTLEMIQNIKNNNEQLGAFIITNKTKIEKMKEVKEHAEYFKYRGITYISLVVATLDARELNTLGISSKEIKELYGML